MRPDADEPALWPQSPLRRFVPLAALSNRKIAPGPHLGRHPRSETATQNKTVTAIILKLCCNRNLVQTTIIAMSSPLLSDM
jgi:hypothetical protein